MEKASSTCASKFVPYVRVKNNYSLRAVENDGIAYVSDITGVFFLMRAAVLLTKISKASNLLIPWEHFSISLSMASYLNPHQRQRQCAW